MSDPGTPQNAAISQPPQQSPLQGSAGAAGSPPLVAPQPRLPQQQQHWNALNPAVAANQPLPQQGPGPTVLGQLGVLPPSLVPLVNSQASPRGPLAASPPAANAGQPMGAQTPHPLQAQIPPVANNLLSNFQPFGMPQFPLFSGQNTPPILGGGHQAILQQLKASSDLQRIVQLQIQYLVSSLLQSGLTIDQISFLMGQNGSLAPPQFPAQPQTPTTAQFGDRSTANLASLANAANLGAQANASPNVSGAPQFGAPGVGRDSDGSHAPGHTSTDARARPSTRTEVENPRQPAQTPQSQAQTNHETELNGTSPNSQGAQQSAQSLAGDQARGADAGSPLPASLVPAVVQPPAPEEGKRRWFKHVLPESLRSSQGAKYIASTTTSEPPANLDSVLAGSSSQASPTGRRAERSVGRPRTKNRVDNLNSQEDPLRHSRDMSIMVSDPSYAAQEGKASTPSQSSEPSVQRRGTFFARFVEVNPAVKSPLSHNRVGRPPKARAGRRSEAAENDDTGNSAKADAGPEADEAEAPVKVPKKRGRKPGSRNKPPLRIGLDGDSKTRRELRAKERRSRDSRAARAVQGEDSKAALDDSRGFSSPSGMGTSTLPPPVQPRSGSESSDEALKQDVDSANPSRTPSLGVTGAKRYYRGDHKVGGAPPPVMPLNARLHSESDENYDSDESDDGREQSEEDSEEDDWDPASRYKPKRRGPRARQRAQQRTQQRPQQRRPYKRRKVVKTEEESASNASDSSSEEEEEEEEEESVGEAQPANGRVKV